MTHQGICPEGWHIPSDKEWGVLRDFCGGREIAGAFLKADAGWNDGSNGNNKSGFSALPQVTATTMAISIMPAPPLRISGVRLIIIEMAMGIAIVMVPTAGI
jgi:hypothetical protein